ncbi:MAG: ABC transporter substrate-binding protein [Rubrivivax sp.]|nr:ABC transporter substrate-binding protein [Rubrivivax sp.]
MRGDREASGELGELGQARRRLAALLATTPFAGALHAAAPQRTRAAALPAPNGAPDDGEDFTGRWVHAFAAYGPPKYGPDFRHFDYVDPDAPKGGTLRLKNPDRRTSFDKFNPWTTRGNAPAGVLIWMVEGLGHLGQDEPLTIYGLLAEAINVAPDFGSVLFRIREQARFANGDPVLAEDVRHSFAMLSGAGASPAYQTLLSGIARAEVLEPRLVRFVFKEKSREQVFTAATMPVFSHKWGEGKPFDQVVGEHPILSGPYVIDKVDMPRRIELRLNPDYWGRDLAVRRGHFNFERVVYRMYSDNLIALEAFKAGEFDLIKEYRSRTWVRQHKGVKWDDGRIVKSDMKTGFGWYMQAYNINLRRPLFQDIRVREALVHTYDFETLNKTRVFTRVQSAFNNTEFAARGTPGPGELALLEPWRAELPPRVFGPAWQAPRTDGSPHGLRQNLLKARSLLEEAGWKLDDAGVLRNGQGEPFEFEYLQPQVSSNVDWQRNLRKLGITMKDRVVDFALYRRRLQNYDYDMVTIAEGSFTLPEAGTLAALYGSKSFAEPGNSNFRGVNSKAVDALIAAIRDARSMQELRDAARAFDRVVTWSFFQIPDLFSAVENVSHWNKFGKPKTMAPYFRADTIISGFVEHGPWPLWTWWDKSLDRRAA